MEFLGDLWLPIVLSAVFVFVVSSIIHCATPMHKTDFKKLQNEADVLAALRGHGVQPGAYMFPCAGSMKEMGSPEMQAKFKQGPVGHMTILPTGVPSMGKHLLQWFLYTIVISVFVAYIATLGVEYGADYMQVFRVTGATAVLAYAFANVQNSIWKGVAWGTTFKFMFDGLLYGLVTAGAFGWLWPERI